MKKTYFKGLRSGNYVQVKINTDVAEDIKNALMSRMIARVGILGGKTDRSVTVVTKSGLHKAGKALANQTNADIGLLHEKGSLTMHIPRRSFLEMPLVLKSEGLMAARNKIWEAFTLKEQTKARLKAAYVQLGHIAENIIQAAFESGGFGKWEPDSDRTRKEKGSNAPLIDTGQLRRSITSDVVEK